MMQHAQIIDQPSCPSFSCYTTDNLSSSAAARISQQLQKQQHHEEFDHNPDDKDFEFSLVTKDEVFDLDKDHKLFPLFDRELLNDYTTSLGNLFLTERKDCACVCACACASSSESEESENEAPGVFCVWRHKNDMGSSSLGKCKKSSSTGSGSKRWRIRDLLRRSNSEGKEPMVLLRHNNNNKKLVENVPKRKRNVPKPVSSIHEMFYVQQRAEREVGKRRSYLPYRQGLVGFFSNVNGNGNNGKGKGKKSLF